MGKTDEGFLYFQGPPISRYLQKLKDSTRYYANRHGCVYIGITGDIDQRTKTHYSRSKRGGGNATPPKSQGWTRMVAIYNTTDAEDAKKAEKALIRSLRSSPNNAHKCLNKTMGGELIDQYKHYYIYLLLGPESVRRSYWN